MENTDFESNLWVAGLFALIVLSAIVEHLRQSRKRNSINDSFLLECVVADQIRSIEYRSTTIVLAKRTDGRWGIANRDGWLHVGKGKYIATKWKQYTGQWPYIYY
jgi:hypothetical protein